MNLDMFMDLWLTVSASSAPVIIGSALKSLLIVGAAFLMLTIARNAAPVKRVLISRLALLTVVVLPFAILSIPSIRLAIPGFFGSAWSTVVSPVSVSSVADTGTIADSGIVVPWTAWLVIAWLAGATVVWVRVMAGVVLTARMVRKSEPVIDRSIIEMQTSVAKAAGSETPIRIARSNSTDIPFAWGLVKPVIVLPQSSRDWSPKALRMVLLHETSHIKRNDTLWAFIGCAATVLYWFNPLIWILRKQMVIEAEKTCDDSVLRAGSDAPSYAAHLLEVARRIHHRRIVIPAGIAMARGTELEGRLLSILTNRNRVVEMKHWLVRLTAMGALLLVFSLAGLQLRAVNARGSSSLPGITSDTDQEGADTVEEKFPRVDDFVAISKSPEQVSCEELEYPKEALKAGIMEGTVWVQALIDRQGKVRKAQVLKSSGYETLDDAAVKASYRCEYVPAYQDDKPVAVWISYRVNFLADDGEKPDTADEQLPSSTDFVPVTIYPEQVSCEEPEYPKEAKKAGKQGTVWVQALVDKHGKVRKAQVQKSSGHELLDDAAVKAAYFCEYKPAYQDDIPVAVWITYKVSFTLADAK